MIKEKAYGKINIALDVLKKRSDGFHELKMIMIPIDIHDVLTFKISKEVKLIEKKKIENNAILKAVELIKYQFSVKQGVTIELEKNIPVGAGLAGGSADIAATIRGLNRLWTLNMTDDDMKEIALKLGSDTLFCLYNMPAFVYGRGDQLLFIHQIPKMDIYLFPFKKEVLTKEVFQNHKISPKEKRFEKVLNLYIRNKFDKAFKMTFNALEKTATEMDYELKHHQKSVKKISKSARMSGSGGTFYMIVNSSKSEKIEQKIRKVTLNAIKTKPKY